MRCVAIESPFAGDVELNIRYGRACLRDCLKRGEAPFASHLLYTQEGVLNDDIPEERTEGTLAGKEIEKRLDATVVYTDLGISSGMKWGILHAEAHNRPVEYRELGKEWYNNI